LKSHQEIDLITAVLGRSSAVAASRQVHPQSSLIMPVDRFLMKTKSSNPLKIPLKDDTGMKIAVPGTLIIEDILGQCSCTISSVVGQ